MIKKKVNSPSLFCSLADMLDQRHPLYRLADKIDWRRFEETFTPLYSQDMGAPAKDIRLMCGLLILKHVRNLSDKSVVAQWSENAYYQYFCGMDTFSPCQPCASTELVHFRKRIGESGVELILAESIRVNDDHDDKGTFDTGIIDSFHRTGEKRDLPHRREAAEESHRKDQEDCRERGTADAPQLHPQAQGDIPPTTFPQPPQEPQESEAGRPRAAHDSGPSAARASAQPERQPQL